MDARISSNKSTHSRGLNCETEEYKEFINSIDFENDTTFQGQ